MNITKELFLYVSKEFELAKYDDLNILWEDCISYEAIDDLTIVMGDRDIYDIRTENIIIYYKLPTRKIARSVLNRMKELEMLFI